MRAPWEGCALFSDQHTTKAKGKVRVNWSIHAFNNYCRKTGVSRRMASKVGYIKHGDTCSRMIGSIGYNRILIGIMTFTPVYIRGIGSTKYAQETSLYASCHY